VGQILGPLIAGVLALHFGFRAPFFVFAVPTLVFVLLAMRLHEPVRGYYERREAGAEEAAALVPDAPERAWGTMRVLARVRTIRRIWLAVPFLAVVLFGVPTLLSLVYEEVFGLDSAARGAIAAGVEPLQVVGVFLAMPRVAKVAMTDPGFLLRFVGIVGVVDGLLLVILAYAPNVAVAVGMHALLAALVFMVLPTGIAPGALLGSRFEILSVLGSGGMGVVYKARDRELDDLVALKMLKRDVAGDTALVGRLKTELKLARKITHPNVLRTFDFGEIDGLSFISMEYVRGVTLRSLLEESGRLPYAAALRLARQLLSGLAAAHALEILHRDIKPENVILDSGGSLKLMDFGLARPVTRVEAGQTKEGWIVGTPHYLSPEQIEAKEPDKRADVYACGVVLFELFTGELPFTGDAPMDILMKHLRQAPPQPRDLWPDMPAPLEALILRALAKDPAERPADAGALLRELERAAA
jgi:hypothetical protein